MIDPLMNAANWFLAFYSIIPPTIHYLCGLCVVNFFTISLVRMLMRM